jgi:translocation and assembly module TamB
LTGVDSFDVSGPITLGADVSGRVDQPLIKGQLRTENARIESPVTGLVLTGVKASGRFAGGSRFMLDSFSAQAGKDGRVSGSGSFDLAAANGFGIDLALNTDQAAILARDDLGATVTGPIRIQSDGDGGLISADLVLNRSRYRLGRSTAAQAVPRLNVHEINRPVDAVSLGRPASPWRLEIKARADNRVMVTGLGLASEWRADLAIGGSAYTPVLSGRADLLRGDYEFAGRQFAVTRGTIRFQGEDPPDPIVDITAEGDTQGLNASIRVTGTGQRPDIRFASTPTLPEDELLSRLLFGTSITNLSAPEAVQLGAAVASLRGGGNGLNPINALRKAVGLDRLRILPADTITGQRTSIAAGKYLSRRTFVELVTDGQGYSATRAEFQVTRWLSILASISTIGRQTAAVRVSRDY